MIKIIKKIKFSGVPVGTSNQFGLAVFNFDHPESRIWMLHASSKIGNDISDSLSVRQTNAHHCAGDTAGPSRPSLQKLGLEVRATPAFWQKVRAPGGGTDNPIPKAGVGTSLKLCSKKIAKGVLLVTTPRGKVKQRPPIYNCSGRPVFYWLGPPIH
jgi:hypothetical protein